MLLVQSVKAKLHSFANFGLRASLLDLQKMLNVPGLPQLFRWAEAGRQKLIFSCTNFQSMSKYLQSVFSNFTIKLQF